MRSHATKLLVPLAGIEPALLAELDFESSASTNSATGAFWEIGREADARKSGRDIAGAPGGSTRVSNAFSRAFSGSGLHCLCKTPQCDRASARQRRGREIGRF